jgi:hypothetical protein
MSVEIKDLDQLNENEAKILVVQLSAEIDRLKAEFARFPPGYQLTHKFAVGWFEFGQRLARKLEIEWTSNTDLEPLIMAKIEELINND